GRGGAGGGGAPRGGGGGAREGGGTGGAGSCRAPAGGRGSDESSDVIARLSDDADQSPYRRRLPGRNEDLAQNAGTERFHFDVGLVCLNLGQDVAALDPVPFLLEPLDDLAALHRVGELGHDDLRDSHGSVPVRVADAANGGGDP